MIKAQAGIQENDSAQTARAERVSPEEEAMARLHAAEQLAASGHAPEADAQLQRALAFYRAVGATRVVRGAEKVLAAAS